MRITTPLLVTSILFVHSMSAARAQSAPTPAGPLADAHYSRADTLRAVRHLFAKRSKGAVDLAQTGDTMVLKAVRKPWPQPGATVQPQNDRGGWLVGGALLGYSAARLSRFGPERYGQIAAAYEQGEPLPLYVRRQLKTKYFRYRPF